MAIKCVVRNIRPTEMQDWYKENSDIVRRKKYKHLNNGTFIVKYFLKNNNEQIIFVVNYSNFKNA